MTTIIKSKLFMHVSGYDDAPEFSMNDEGVVRIDDKVVEDPAAIVKALADNAKAWAKCVDASVADGDPPPVTGHLADQVDTIVQQYTGVEIHGPWPRQGPANPDEITDEMIDAAEGAGDGVG